MTTDDWEMQLKHAAMRGSPGFHEALRGAQALTCAEMQQRIEIELARYPGHSYLIVFQADAAPTIQTREQADEWRLFECDTAGCKAVFAADKDHSGDRRPLEMVAQGWTSTVGGRVLCPLHRSNGLS
ncbi:hypothetical protein Mycsm_06935 (plasmid) [Mycobacterium sp. JS623]|uniref:hypothetical protein n=1 Tax=Mycobacterium sp. JS623 TaxID=212767 RepID=UPI0002A5B738|nr:hypothetical protein [Mycobacterium sp. JS623]AGB27036.1 hypothetical protein Mycsm_06935 [Mycobacterium sp. JS623]